MIAEHDKLFFESIREILRVQAVILIMSTYSVENGLPVLGKTLLEVEKKLDIACRNAEKAYNDKPSLPENK